jgi:hypothetical protein
MFANPAKASLKVQPLVWNPNILDSVDVFQSGNMPEMWTFEYKNVKFCVRCKCRERLAKAVEKVVQKYWYP